MGFGLLPVISARKFSLLKCPRHGRQGERCSTSVGDEPIRCLNVAGKGWPFGPFASAVGYTHRDLGLGSLSPPVTIEVFNFGQLQSEEFDANSEGQRKVGTKAPRQPER